MRETLKRFEQDWPGTLSIEQFEAIGTLSPSSHKRHFDYVRATISTIQSEISKRNSIFIGHGRSPAWFLLKTFIADDLHLQWEEFNRDASAGYTVTQRLIEMLERASLAFLVMTAEDEREGVVK